MGVPAIRWNKIVINAAPDAGTEIGDVYVVLTLGPKPDELIVRIPVPLLVSVIYVKPFTGDDAYGVKVTTVFVVPLKLKLAWYVE